MLLEYVRIRARILVIREMPSPLTCDLNEIGTWRGRRVRHEECVVLAVVEDATGMTVA